VDLDSLVLILLKVEERRGLEVLPAPLWHASADSLKVNVVDLQMRRRRRRGKP
jgi:hypothetical protein